MTETSFDRKLRRLTIGGVVTLFTVTLLTVYLLPFGYMFMTSLKTPQQIVRNTILPLTQQTYEYRGEELPGYRVKTGQEYPVYQVPINDKVQSLALVRETDHTPSLFLDPETLEIVEWTDDVAALERTDETYKYEGEELAGGIVEAGKEYPIYQVPLGETMRALALVKEVKKLPNIFVDPNTLSIIEWEGDVGSLERASQIKLFTATPTTANAEYGVENSKRYPVYQVQTEEGVQEWALIRGPEHVFIDINHPNDGVVTWKGDITTLQLAQQIVLYKFKGKTDPAIGLVQNKEYPLYQVTLDGAIQEQWALVKRSAHIFIDINNPDAGVFEWTGDLTTLEPGEEGETYTHFGANNREAGLKANESYPVYIAPEQPGEGEQVKWALVRAGTGADESLFINTSAGDALVSAVFDEAFSPVLENAIFLYQPKYNERIYGLVSLGNYPVYLVPGEDGEERQLALVRQGTGTDESIFVNITGVTSITKPEEIEYIREVVDLSSLTPALETESKYRHGSANLPKWSVQRGDKLLLYIDPIDNEGQWALVAAGTPGKSPTYFIDTENPDAGVFEYSDKWVGLLDTVDKLDPQWRNYNTAWNAIDFPRLLFNTLAIAVIGVVGTLASCTLVAYGFARFPIPYKNVIFMVLIATIILPRQVTLIPTFAFFSRIGWTNTWLPLLVPHFFANAYNVFLLRQFFQTIPREMDEAAMIDGAGPFRTLISVILPQAYPALVAAGLFHLVFAWNDYFEPLIYLLGRPDLQPISVGVQQFNFIYNRQPNLIQATSLMAMLLPILVFFFAQRFFMRGIVITGVEK